MVICMIRMHQFYQIYKVIIILGDKHGYNFGSWNKSIMESKKTTILFVDNMPLVHILNNKSSRSDRVMSFLRP